LQHNVYFLREKRRGFRQSVEGYYENQLKMQSSHENLAPQVIQGLIKELRQLSRKPPVGVKYVPNDDDTIGTVHSELEGPVGTPFEGGVFHIKLVLGKEFPSAPPKGFFLTKIFHPNIASNGDICVNTLKKDWKPDLGISHVLQVIRCLLIVPFPESSLNEEAGRMFMEDYEAYDKRAKLYTNIHAQPKCKPMSPTPTSEGQTKLSPAKNKAKEVKGDKVARKKSKSSGATKKSKSKKKGLKRL
jgi:ubiquitin-conjugating enzyme E2 S